MNKLLLVIAILCGVFLAYVDSSPGWDDTGITAGRLLVSAGLIPLVGAYAGWAVRRGVRKTLHLA